MNQPSDQTQAAVLSLAKELHTPVDGAWYQVTAYVRMAADGINTVSNAACLPIRSYRELRVINEAQNNEGIPPVAVAGE